MYNEITDKGIVEFYYSKNLPNNSVAIAKIVSSDTNPSDLVTINNLNIIGAGNLSLWKNTTALTSPADFIAPDLNQSITIHGATTYYIDNQFFEITNIVSNDSTPLYYQHTLPIGILVANILNSSGEIVDAEILVQNNILYHSQDNNFYKVRYIDSSGFIYTEMLLFTPVISQSIYSPNTNLYTYTAKVLTVFNSGNYHLRFIQRNGYQVLTPYKTASNVPWFARIRYAVSPTPPEWATQAFLPVRPYLLGTWVTGSVINTNTIQFERTRIYNNPNRLPDILVFDSNNIFKYALDGTAINSVSNKGYEYNWRKGLINQVDNYTGRVTISVDLDPTDIIFGFYSYQETDIVYTAIDINPFTNPLVKNTQITFYLKTNGQDTTKYLYYNLVNEVGEVIQTNDPSPNTGTNQIFSQLVVGASVGISDLTVTDIRVRGGGLAPDYQNIPEAANFWDLGYWDGKPFPVAGAMIVYLPQTVLNNMSVSDVESKIQSILPLGMLPVIKYYNSEGNEY